MSSAQTPQVTPSRQREAMLALALAGLAALRVFLFAAAFPLFANVDEHRHIDAALKYARGYLPLPDTDSYEPETGELLGLFGSPEYLWDDASEPTRQVPPPAWAQERRAALERVAWGRRFLAKRRNLEAYQPPVYYASAGAWLRLGRSLGLEGGHLLYWTRGLGVIATFALVLGSHRLLRRLYPDDAFVRLGVPLLLAAFPLDVVYYITGDAITPVLGGLGFLLALRATLVPDARAGVYAAAGLMTAAALLTKYTAAAPLAACAVGSLVAVRRPAGARTSGGKGGRLVLLWLAALVPLGCWLLRNQLLFDSITGTAHKTARMGWGTKTFAEYWDHPIFTPAGFGVFVGELIPSFWRGELAWHRATLAGPVTDRFYTLSTLLIVGLSALGLRWPDRSGARAAEAAALLAVLGSVAVLGWLSLLFIFHETSVPSADLPYFVQGRLIAAALVPFALLYVRGIQVATAILPAQRRTAAAVLLLVAVVAIATASELHLHREVFSSGYNWFHLP